jgi:hypothetical protein
MMPHLKEHPDDAAVLESQAFLFAMLNVLKSKTPLTQVCIELLSMDMSAFSMDDPMNIFTFPFSPTQKTLASSSIAMYSES